MYPIKRNSCLKRADNMSDQIRLAKIMLVIFRQKCNLVARAASHLHLAK